MFTESEFRKIEMAVEEAEAHTSGEIVVHFVDQSAGYRWVPWGAALISSLLTALLTWGLAWRESWQFSALRFIEVQALSAAVAFSFASWAPIRRKLVRASEMAGRVHMGALAQFVLSGVATTRDRTGVLIYLSKFERRVEIIADAGIHKILGAGYWAVQADAIVTGIRAGRAVEAVCETVALMGRRLGEHFPRKADDENELPNAPTSGKFDKDPRP